MNEILVAAPICRDKDYVLDEYLCHYHAFDYDEKVLVFCDNSNDGGEYAEYLKDKCDWVLRSYPKDNILKTVDAAWDKILSFAQFGHFDTILSIESDVLCPPNTIRFMVDMLREHDCAVVSHSVPQSGKSKDFLMNALGCTIFKSQPFIQHYTTDRIFEGDIYGIPKRLGLRVMQIDNFLEIEHKDTRHYNEALAG